MRIRPVGDNPRTAWTLPAQRLDGGVLNVTPVRKDIYNHMGRRPDQDDYMDRVPGLPIVRVRNPIFQASLRECGSAYGRNRRGHFNPIYESREFPAQTSGFRDEPMNRGFRGGATSLEEFTEAARGGRLTRDGDWWCGLFTFRNHGGNLLVMPYAPKAPRDAAPLPVPRGVPDLSEFITATLGPRAAAPHRPA